MATNNRDRNWDRDEYTQDDNGFRGDDEHAYVVPVPLNNPTSGASSGFIPYVATGRPYEGLSDEMAEANDDPQRGEHYGRGPAGYKRSDARIDEEINDHLTEHSYIDATEIVVTVKDGEVTLEGSVPDKDQKYYAEEVAEKVPGVSGVNNLLKIKKPQDSLLQNTSGKQ